MWPQNVKSCSHNSKCDCKMLKVAVIIRNVTAKCWKLQSWFEMWLQNVESCGHISKSAITWLQNSKCDRKMLKVAVIIRNVTATFNILQSDFEICNHVTATLEMWLQFFKICHHVTATFEIWLQNSKSDRKIRKYDGKFWKMTAIF